MFKNTKIKLTAWYLAILMFITMSFSVFVYSSVVSVTNRAFEAQRVRNERKLARISPQFTGPNMPPLIDPETIGEIRERTLFLLLIINLAIFVVAGTLSYFLAGITLKPIEEMLNKQRRFVADAAHELRTPLTALKTDFEVTLRDQNITKEGARGVIASAIPEVNRLSGLVNRMLKQSMYENGSKEFKMEPISVVPVIQEAIRIVKPITAKNNINVALEGEGGTISGDKSALKEVFVNLIENAVKFSSKGQSVRVATNIRNNDVIIDITDKGIGITESDKMQIFNPFYKSDGSRNISNNKGFGLGLTICKEIVEAHGGNISVKSELGVGSTFSVSIPLLKVALSASSQNS